MLFSQSAIQYERLLVSNCNVLISGETGTGKSTFARDLHNRSNRASKPLCVKPCGAKERDVFSVELFGRDSLSGENNNGGKTGVLQKCSGGTLILDDVDSLDAPEQSSLLGFLDNREASSAENSSLRQSADVRVIATTNCNLKQVVSSGHLRQDLFFRLSEFSLTIPPLRKNLKGFERTVLDAQKRVLLEHGNDGLPKRVFSAEAMSLLKLHDWPGNLRELTSVVRLVHLMTEARSAHVISCRSLISMLESSPLNFIPSLHERARADPTLVAAILRSVNFNKSLAARISGYSRETIYQLIHRHGWRV